jgi:hypothetical protein
MPESMPDIQKKSTDALADIATDSAIDNPTDELTDVATEALTDISPDDQTPKRSPGLIGKVLAPAVRLWLKSQTEHLEDLKLSIQAGDRQILSGQIPRIEASVVAAVYQGIHIRDLQLTAQEIQVNLGQVMRGKALKLLAAFPIDLKFSLSEEDLNRSLCTPMIQQAVTQFLMGILGSADGSSQNRLAITNLKAKLQDDIIVLCGNLPSSAGDAQVNTTEIAIRTGLQLTQPNKIALQNPVWLPHAKAKRGMAITELNGYEFDLGPGTSMTEVTIELGKISCVGRLTVLP